MWGDGFFVSIPPNEKVLYGGKRNIKMDDLISILRQGNANVRLEVSGADLLAFSNELINRAKSELSVEIAENTSPKRRSRGFAAFAMRRCGIGTGKVTCARSKSAIKSDTGNPIFAGF